MIFQILIDENLVYSSDCQEGNAIGLNPKLVQQFNLPDDLQFTKLQDIDINKKSIVRVLQDGNEIFRGRQKSSSMSFDKLTTIKCEGQMAFLGDSVQPQIKYTDQSIPSILEAIIGIHNAQVDDYKQFQLGECGVNTFIDFETNYQSTMEVLKSLASERSGYIRFRKPVSGNKYYLDFLSYNSGALATQKVRFGENLLDFNRNKSISSVYSIIVPLGANMNEGTEDGEEKRLTIEEVNDGKDALQNDTLVATYGKIAKVKTYDNIKTASALKTRALYDLNNQLTDITLEVKFLDQHWIDSSIPTFKIGNQVQVISEPHDLDKAFILSKMTLEFDHPENSMITLGRSANTKLTTALSQVSGTAIQALDNIATRNAITWQAQQMANRMFNIDGTGSFIQFDVNEDGVVEQIFAMDSPDASLAQKKLVINKNGVGGSSDGGQNFTTAITTEGWIWGQRIIAGSIDAAQIKVESESETGETVLLDTTLGNIIAEVGTKTDEGEVKTIITQSPDKVQIAWNNISKVIQFKNAELQIYDGPSDGATKLIAFTYTGMDTYNPDGNRIGYIHRNNYTGTSKYGLVFDLDANGHFMGWGMRSSASDDFTLKLWYNKNQITHSGVTWASNTIFLGCDINSNGNKFRGIHASTDGSVGITTSGSFYLPADTDFTSYYGPYKLKNGIIVSA